MTSGPSAPLRPVASHTPLPAVLLLGLALGLVIGLGLSRATSIAPSAAPPGASASPPATTPETWVTGASVAPDLMQAYYAIRETSAGLAPVVCTTDTGLACQGVPAHPVLDLADATPTSPKIPNPDELWPELVPVHLAQTGGAVNVLLIDDLSPALYSQADIQVAGQGEPWHARGSVSPVSVNGAVAVMDLGRLVVGRYVVLIRQIFAVPPDPHGLVENWKAIGIEVNR